MLNFYFLLYRVVQKGPLISKRVANISQGSVVTRLRCGWIGDCYKFTAENED